MTVGVDSCKQSLRISFQLFERHPQKLPSLRWEGIKGRGDQTVSVLSTPTLTLPHQKGEGIIGEISNILGYSLILFQRPLSPVEAASESFDPECEFYHR
jgi:hypothetical protein